MSRSLILRVCREHGLLRNQAAYVLATAEHETAGSFEPVREAYYIGSKAEAWRKKNLRYYPWYGRGFVQLTWEDNYKKAGKKLGLDLTTDPDRVMEPEIAAQILVRGMKEGWFTTKKLGDYITLKRSDFVGARQIVNGTDRAGKIAKLAKKYDRELKAVGYGVDAPSDTPAPKPRPNLLARILGWLLGIFTKGPSE